MCWCLHAIRVNGHSHIFIHTVDLAALGDSDLLAAVCRIGNSRAAHRDHGPVSYTHLDVYKRQAWNGSKWHIDLKAVNALWLRREGVTCIAICDHCTACRPDLYWSHRKMGRRRGEQAALIALRERCV